MFIMIKVIFSSCNRMTTGCIWPSPGAHYLFFGVNTGGDKLRVPRKPRQADREPLPLPGGHLFGVGALGARLGVCAHLLRGHIRLAGSTPAPLASARAVCGHQYLVARLVASSLRSEQQMLRSAGEVE